ncbi:MAG: SDR family oxidoreductase [Rhizobiales bacterium]|nr:SDR family oxidoreductase [Hyphomicrobiales bacterium]
MTKVAIVTAAGRGMGAAVARRLAADGYRLALLSPGETVLPLAEELGGIALRGSLTEPADIERLVALAMERFGRIDAAVINTGHPPKGPLLELTDSDWHAGLDMVFLSVVRLARLLTPQMERQGGGAFVTITSAWALEPQAAFPLTTLRAAVSAWVKLYADLHAARGIRMNAVLPGYIDSLPEKPERRAAIPAGRYGEVREIADTVAFLLSDAASYITGQSLRVDGGLMRSVT